MKLRVRIRGQTSRVELPGEEPSLKELADHVRDAVLPSHGLGADTEFSLSLNGSELLSDAGQTLTSCGIVSGDLICVILPQSQGSTSTSPAPISPAPINPTPTSSISSTPISSSSTASGGPRDQQASTSDHMSGVCDITACCDVTSFVNSQPSSPSAAPDDAGPMMASGPLVYEPMLCGEAEEGQAPLALERLFHSGRIQSAADGVMVAGNLLMLETGFVCDGGELKGGELKGGAMPAGWRSASGVYRLQYSHPLSEDTRSTLVGVAMGPLLVITATLTANETTNTICKLCLKPSGYVTDGWRGESAAAAFKHLSKLSRVFKDSLAYPLIAAARQAMALPVVFGLAALPPELLLRVLRLLDVHSLVKLSALSRHFSAATSDPSLWRQLYCRDFRDGQSRPRDTDWKELYKRSYELRCRNLRLTRSFQRSPWNMDEPFPFPNPFLPPLPGIIGGEYDQRPGFPVTIPPRPRYDPIGPLQEHNRRPRRDNRRVRLIGGQSADVRRGFI